MSISTIGFVCTEDKPVMQVLRLVNKALKKYGEEARLPVRISEMEITTSGSVYVKFVLGYYNPRTKVGLDTAEFRMLAVQFECDNDYSYLYAGKKITFSLGNYNSSQLIITAILKEVSCLGTTYYTPNDSLDGNWSRFRLTNHLQPKN